MPRGQARRLHARLAWTLILIGTGLRLLAYAQHLPLSVDEQLIALNIGARSFRELLDPLSLAQSAPPLFLWLERAIVDVGGVNEWTLRAIPLLAGILTLPLAWRVARRQLGSEAAALAVGLLALSPMLIYESAFVKPYTLDALVTVVLLGVALSPAVRLDRWRGSLLLAATGAVAVGLSLPSVFTVGAIGLAILFRCWRSKDHRALGRMAIVIATWLISLAATLMSTHRGLMSGSLAARYMHDFWERFFLVGNAPGMIQRARDAVAEMFRGPLAGDPTLFPDAVSLPGLGMLFAFVAAAGVVHLLTRRRVELVTVLVGPLLLVACASTLQAYPIASRLMLWSTPLVGCLVAAGAMSLANLLPSRRALVATALTVTLLVPGAMVRGQKTHHQDAGLRQLLAAVPEGEPVYVYPGGIPAWLHYSTDWRAPDRERLRWGMELADLGGAAAMFRWRLQERIDRERIPDRALVNSSSGRVDVVGRSSGLDFVHESQRWVKAPEPGWAAHEAARIRTASAPCITLLLIHIDVAERGVLHQAIASLSGEIQPLLQQPRAFSFVERVCFSQANSAMDTEQ